MRNCNGRKNSVAEDTWNKKIAFGNLFIFALEVVLIIFNNDDAAIVCFFVFEVWILKDLLSILCGKHIAFRIYSPFSYAILILLPLYYGWKFEFQKMPIIATIITGILIITILILGYFQQKYIYRDTYGLFVAICVITAVVSIYQVSMINALAEKESSDVTVRIEENDSAVIGITKGYYFVIGDYYFTYPKWICEKVEVGQEYIIAKKKGLLDIEYFDNRALLEQILE